MSSYQPFTPAEKARAADRSRNDPAGQSAQRAATLDRHRSWRGPALMGVQQSRCSKGLLTASVA